jgi:hypothetical protein
VTRKAAWHSRCKKYDGSLTAQGKFEINCFLNLLGFHFKWNYFYQLEGFKFVQAKTSKKQFCNLF